MEKEPIGEQGLFEAAVHFSNQGFKDFVLIAGKPGKDGEEEIQIITNVNIPDSVYFLELAKHDLMFPSPEEA